MRIDQEVCLRISFDMNQNHRYCRHSYDDIEGFFRIFKELVPEKV